MLASTVPTRWRRRPGPAVAGALIRIVGAPLSVLVDAVTYLFSAVMVATLRTVPEPPPTSSARVSARGSAAEIGEGARWVYGGSGLRGSRCRPTSGSRPKRSWWW